MDKYVELYGPDKGLEMAKAVLGEPYGSKPEPDQAAQRSIPGNASNRQTKEQPSAKS